MRTFTPTGIFFLLLLLLSACGGGSSELENEVTGPAGYKTFSYSSGGGEIEQVLQVKWRNDSAISFVLEHRHGSCNYTLSGDAVNLYFTYDPESDTDTKTGEDYWIDQYLYSRGSCRMAIRMAQDTSKAQLQLANCVASPTCAIESVGMLSRQQ